MRQQFKFHILAAALFLMMMPYKSMAAAQQSHHSIRDHTSKQLQKKLDQRIKALHLSRAVKEKRLNLVLVDITNPDAPKLAQVNGDQMMYAASLPKIAVLLTAFELIKQGKLPLNRETRDTMTRMIRYSSNKDATAMIDMVGKDYINTVMESPKYRLYDPKHNGGLWVGKEYAGTAPFHRDPLHNLSHGASAMQVARFYYMMQTGQLVSPRYSAEMKGIMADSGINHKFVKGLDAMHNPDIRMYRKSGTWRDWHADSALIEHGGHRYIAVALAHDPKGGEWLKNIIHEMDDIIVAQAPVARELAQADITQPATTAETPHL
ncbi:serine hydrolase [Mariprofundus ferrooxydans]|uniref:serine hydrolase n=1 Tax=Mariprofundus ferrooxydans TaxID=314344 RepID=UPI00142F3FFA|nr:serine hydrolase [Mariprofundus ferrooxydans]